MVKLFFLKNKEIIRLNKIVNYLWRGGTHGAGGGDNILFLHLVGGYECLLYIY